MVVRTFRSGALLPIVCLLTAGAALHGVIRLGWLAAPPAVGRLAAVSYGVWLAVAFLAVQCGIGAVVLRRGPLARLTLSPVEETCFAYGLGSYLSYSALLGLAPSFR